MIKQRRCIVIKNFGTKTIITDRLILRRFELFDAENMQEGWVTDEKVTKYVSWSVHKDLQQTIDLLNQWISEYENGSLNWVVELKENGKLIGNIMVIHVSKKHNYCEIGYCYGSPYWNHGYATESLKAVIDYLLDECEFHVVEAKHHSTNPASGRVMEKAGMTKEAILKDRIYSMETDSYRDLVCYYKMRLS